MECGKTCCGAYYPQSASQNNVFFRPAMNLLAMRAGELGRFYFGSGPELFVNGLAGDRQLGGGRATNQQSLNDRTSFYFPCHGCSKKFHFLRGGRRCAPCQCRKATSG